MRLPSYYAIGLLGAPLLGWATYLLTVRDGRDPFALLLVPALLVACLAGAAFRAGFPRTAAVTAAALLITLASWLPVQIALMVIYGD